MCTATWWNGADGYELFFNRDELITRAAGLPPREQTLRGVRYLAPEDPTGGGTWLLVNEFGLSVCLINQYPEDALDPGPRRVSRGQLVRSLADCRDSDAVRSRVRGADLTCYEGFMLIAVEPGRPGRMMHWDTRQLLCRDETEAPQPYTSSRHLPDEVISSRRRRFADLIRLRGGDPTPDDLRAFHEHFAPQTAAHSVFMQRDDAATVSLSHVVVGEDSITLEYSPRLPGQFHFDRARRAQLRRRAAYVA